MSPLQIVVPSTVTLVEMVLMPTWETVMSMVPEWNDSATAKMMMSITTPAIMATTFRPLLRGAP